ncbi:hypothetical protein D3C84_1161490 [compost metagenome]
MLESNTTGVCPVNAAVSMSGSGLEDFSVSLACVKLPCAAVTCAQSYTEGTRTFNLYRLTATAANGSPDSRVDYAWRRLEVTVER